MEGPSSSGSPGFGFEADADVTLHASMGQHLLVDQNVIDQAVRLIPEGARCVEIGAGTGLITASLLERGCDVLAYEIDHQFEPALGRLALAGKLEVRWQDFLEASERELNEQVPYHIVGNIPYHISEPLMAKLGKLRFASAVLLVGQRLASSITTASPERDGWDRMSLVAGAYFNVTKKADIPREAYEPRPRTDGAMVEMTRKDAADEPLDGTTRAYRAIVEAGASNRTLASALKSVATATRDEGGKGKLDRQKSHRSERRAGRAALSAIAEDYNTYGGAGVRNLDPSSTGQNIYHAVARSVDKKALSQPLTSLTNQELRRVCLAITNVIGNRRKRS